MTLSASYAKSARPGGPGAAAGSRRTLSGGPTSLSVGQSPTPTSPQFSPLKNHFQAEPDDALAVGPVDLPEHRIAERGVRVVGVERVGEVERVDAELAVLGAHPEALHE